MGAYEDNYESINHGYTLRRNHYVGQGETDTNQDNQQRYDSGLGPKRRRSSSLPLREAAHGWNGMVNMPTVFVAGEAGPEHVNIRPIKKGKGKKSQVIDPFSFGGFKIDF